MTVTVGFDASGNSKTFKPLSSRYSVMPSTAVTRATYEEARALSYDVIVNAAMPAGRFWAKNNPERDFVETVEKTAKLLYGWRYTSFVQVSSVSAR